MSTYLSGTARSFTGKIESAFGTAPGASGAKKFRRSKITLNKKKDRYTSDEIRDDFQRTLSSSGGERVEGNLECQLSCGSHQEFFEALVRQAAAAPADITGLTLDVAIVGGGPTYTITRAAGSWITDGVREGMTVRATAGLNAASLNRNLAVTALSATIMTVYPWDAGTLTAESGVAACTVATPGKRCYMPSSGHIERSFYLEDGLSSTFRRLFSGVEVNNLACDFSPGKNAKANFGFLGQDMQTAGAAYYTSPTALDTRRPLSGPRGIILMDGVLQGVLTQLTINPNANLSQKPVIGSVFAPAIGQGPLTGAGQASMLVTDKTFVDKYLADTPFELLIYLRETTAGNTDFMTFHLPACQQNDNTIDDGEQLLEQGFPFEFAKPDTAVTGQDQTVLAIQDSQYV